MIPRNSQFLGLKAALAALAADGHRFVLVEEGPRVDPEKLAADIKAQQARFDATEYTPRPPRPGQSAERVFVQPQSRAFWKRRAVQRPGGKKSCPAKHRPN